MSLHYFLHLNLWDPPFRWSCLSLKLSSNTSQSPELHTNGGIFGKSVIAVVCYFVLSRCFLIPSGLEVDLLKKKKKKTIQKGQAHKSEPEREKEVLSLSSENRSLQFPGQTCSQDVAKSGKCIKRKLWVFCAQLCSISHGLFVALNEHHRNNHNRHLYGTGCFLNSFHKQERILSSQQIGDVWSLWEAARSGEKQGLCWGQVFGFPTQHPAPVWSLFSTHRGWKQRYLSLPLGEIRQDTMKW